MPNNPKGLIRCLQHVQSPKALTRMGGFNQSIVDNGSVRIVRDTWRGYGRGVFVSISRTMVEQLTSGRLHCAENIIMLSKVSKSSPLYGTHSVNVYSAQRWTGRIVLLWRVNRSATICHIFTSFPC